MQRTRRCSEHERFLRVTTKLEFCRPGELWTKNNRSSHPWWPGGKEKKWQGRLILIAVHNRRAQPNLVFAGLCYHTILSNPLLHQVTFFPEESQSPKRKKKGETTVILQSPQWWNWSQRGHWQVPNSRPSLTSSLSVRPEFWLLIPFAKYYP